MNYAAANDGAKLGSFPYKYVFCLSIFLHVTAKQQTGPENDSGKLVQFVAR